MVRAYHLLVGQFSKVTLLLTWCIFLLLTFQTRAFRGLIFFLIFDLTSADADMRKKEKRIEFPWPLGISGKVQPTAVIGHLEFQNSFVP